MKNFTQSLTIETKRQFELRNVTEELREIVKKSGIQEGIATIFCPHTTASVKITQDEPLLIQDLMKAVYRLVPVDTSYSHDLFELRQNVAPNERSNGHAHVKSFLLGCSENLAITKGQLLLGGKQSVFFVEFDGGRSRNLYVKIIGE